MPNTITRYECTVCKGLYDTSAKATACEGSHPGTMSFDRAHQVYKGYDIVPDNISITHDGKTYKYFRKV